LLASSATHGRVCTTSQSGQLNSDSCVSKSCSCVFLASNCRDLKKIVPNAPHQIPHFYGSRSGSEPSSCKSTYGIAA
jgi:hypothetical protein